MPNRAQPPAASQRLGKLLSELKFEGQTTERKTPSREVLRERACTGPFKIASRSSPQSVLVLAPFQNTMFLNFGIPKLLSISK